MQSRLIIDSMFVSNLMYLGEKTMDSTVFFVLFLGNELAKPKFLECLMFRLRSAFFVCVNSVISHESAIICSFYIFHLLKIVFFIDLYYNISLIILTTRDARYWIFAHIQ